MWKSKRTHISQLLQKVCSPVVFGVLCELVSCVPLGSWKTQGCRHDKTNTDLFIMSLKTSLTSVWKTTGVLVKPKGITRYSQWPWACWRRSSIHLLLWCGPSGMCFSGPTWWKLWYPVVVWTRWTSGEGDNDSWWLSHWYLVNRCMVSVNRPFYRQRRIQPQQLTMKCVWCRLPGIPSGIFSLLRSQVSTARTGLP